MVGGNINHWTWNVGIKNSSNTQRPIKIYCSLFPALIWRVDIEEFACDVRGEALILANFITLTMVIDSAEGLTSPEACKALDVRFTSPLLLDVKSSSCRKKKYIFYFFSCLRLHFNQEKLKIGSYDWNQGRFFLIQREGTTRYDNNHSEKWILKYWKWWKKSTHWTDDSSNVLTFIDALCFIFHIRFPSEQSLNGKIDY